MLDRILYGRDILVIYIALSSYNSIYDPVVFPCQSQRGLIPYPVSVLRCRAPCFLVPNPPLI
jgi:hypothetical protein